ncbi:MAG: hypothetical protein OXE74_02445 [Cyanobacteria bacterium MAG CAR2_bin_4]|nr:hypothetical protein [Cyanobacteria bacterium MAG CAR2_bin_4]
MGQVLGIREGFFFKPDQDCFFNPPMQPLPMQPPEPVSLEEDQPLPEPDSLETPEPVSDNEIISEMLEDCYKLALLFHGNNKTKATKFLELVIYLPIFGVFGYRKLKQKMKQDSTLFECLSSEDITKLQKQLDKVIPLLERAKIDGQSQTINGEYCAELLWIHLKYSSILGNKHF